MHVAGRGVGFIYAPVPACVSLFHYTVKDDRTIRISAPAYSTSQTSACPFQLRRTSILMPPGISMLPKIRARALYSWSLHLCATLKVPEAMDARFLCLSTPSAWVTATSLIVAESDSRTLKMKTWIIPGRVYVFLVINEQWNVVFWIAWWDFQKRPTVIIVHIIINTSSWTN